MLVATLVGCALPAWGLVAGTPEPPRPGPLPAAWFGWSNDSFGGSIGRDMDDFRTNAFSLGLRWNQFVLVTDYSMLTDYRMPGASRLRSDELSTSLGYELIPDGTPALGGKGWLAAGVGIRVHGDMAGDAIQNRWHDRIHNTRVDIDYAPQRGSEGLTYCAGTWQITNPDAWTLPGIGDIAAHRTGFEVSGSLLGTSDGAVDAAAGISLVVVGVDGGVALGLRQEWHTGKRASQPARATAENESGTWVTLTSSVGGWYFSCGYNLDDRAGMGTIGWMWSRPPGRTDDAEVSVMEGIVGFYQGYSYGFQYRWHTAWLDQLTSDHLALIADYRFGQHPQQSWRDNGIVVRQPLLGLDWSFGEPQDGFQVIPFIYGGVGIREERVVINGLRPRFPMQKNITGVAQAGLGLRIFFGDKPTRTNPARYGLSMVYDGWLPFHRAEAENATGTDQARYQMSGHGFGLRLAAMAMW